MRRGPERLVHERSSRGTFWERSTTSARAFWRSVGCARHPSGGGRLAGARRGQGRRRQARRSGRPGLDLRHLVFRWRQPSRSWRRGTTQGQSQREQARPHSESPASGATGAIGKPGSGSPAWGTPPPAPGAARGCRGTSAAWTPGAASVPAANAPSARGGAAAISGLSGGGGGSAGALGQPASRSAAAAA